MKAINILIVEDEILIAKTIELYLTERGHKVVGIAISYEEALQYIQETTPDLVLLDIRLSGQKSGIDVANYLQEQGNGTPYVMLSSQYDAVNIEKAMSAGASGYITKPIAKETLWSTVELAVLKFENDVAKGAYIDIKIGRGTQRIKLADILYVKSDHVYVEIICTSTKYTARYSISQILELLTQSNFIQCHRSYIINANKIQKYNGHKLRVGDTQIPVSEKYRNNVKSILEGNR